MSTHKHFDRICCVAVIIALLITTIFMNAETFGITASDRIVGYENRLFDTSTVHTIDIVMDDWDSFLDTCQSEEYSMCTIVIDGEAYKNVGIRGKGNTSLSSVASMNSERYSFKVEFDQYDSTSSYYGLDKLCLNNIIQDNTYMKDYLVYQMMNDFGVDSPLCSYVYITVNGEDWGLYLAVEGIEDGFLYRNYGSDSGELYKPDSMSFGGGRGNGKDFNMDDFDFDDFDFGDLDLSEIQENFDPTSFGGGNMQMPDGFDPASSDNGNMQMPDGFDPASSNNSNMQMPDDFDPASSDNGNMQMPDGFDPASSDNGNMQMPDGFDPTSAADANTQNPDTPSESDSLNIPDDFKDKMSDFADKIGDFADSFGGMSMGSSDVKLQYIDDDPNSYSNIFDNAKTDITEEDQQRLIASLKTLSSYENIEDVINIDEVIRYFVVHNFVVNGDSYTGSMIHNYYLYEKDGQLSMIPWDYNLAFGTFQGSNANSSVNDSIDYSDGSMDDRPMLNWIFENEEYTELYYQYFEEFISQYFDSGYFTELINSTIELISPYVEKDPTKFCTYEEFELGAETLREFCLLRAESVSLQIEGSTETVDASSITISDMGTMNNGSMGGGIQMPENFGDMNGGMQMPNNPNDMNSGMQMPENTDDTTNNDFSNSFGGSSTEITDTDETENAASDETKVSEPASDPFANKQPESSNRPENQPSDRSEIPGFNNTSMQNEWNQETFILLGACGVILLAGLLFAWKYRKY